MSKNTNKYEKLSTNELHDMLRKLESKCSEDASKQRDRQVYIGMLHEYNNLKDSTQTVLGALANIQNTTLREMHLKFDLPTNE